jgi:hypothetical protein
VHLVGCSVAEKRRKKNVAGERRRDAAPNDNQGYDTTLKDDVTPSDVARHGATLKDDATSNDVARHGAKNKDDVTPSDVARHGATPNGAEQSDRFCYSTLKGDARVYRISILAQSVTPRRERDAGCDDLVDFKAVRFVFEAPEASAVQWKTEILKIVAKVSELEPILLNLFSRNSQINPYLVIFKFVIMILFGLKIPRNPRFLSMILR